MALEKVGVLWFKQDRNGGEYLSGYLNLGILGQVTVMIFPNQKQKPNHPDRTINIAVPDKIRSNNNQEPADDIPF